MTYNDAINDITMTALEVFAQTDCEFTKFVNSVVVRGANTLYNENTDPFYVSNTSRIETTIYEMVDEVQLLSLLAESQIEMGDTGIPPMYKNMIALAVFTYIVDRAMVLAQDGGEPANDLLACAIKYYTMYAELVDNQFGDFETVED